jgi:hypothetical protein
VSCIRTSARPDPNIVEDFTRYFVGLRWATRRRFAASYFAPKTARAMDGLEIPQQRRAFLEYELYWRLATCSVFGVETAVFSRASYFVLLVQLK